MKASSDMVSREGFVEKLVAELIGDADDSSELRVISVLGERAIGKTALVRSVYDRVDIKRRFECCAWVRVLAGSGLEDILFDVLRQTTMRELKDVDRLREEHLSEKLNKTLMEQRYLVVLDNIQSVDLMEELLTKFTDSRNGSRLIITTRNENMSLHSGPRHCSHLELCRLTGEESRELLIKSGWTDDDPERTAAILGKCNGCPPVIRLLGGFPSTAEEDCRSTLADRVPNYHTLGELISLCYDSLPAWLRPSLLYLVLFPRESEIPVRRLFNIWLADGFLSSQQARQGQVRERRPEECLDALLARNMVHAVRWKLDGSAKTCLMPGFLHDFMSEMTMDVGTLEISDDSVSTSSRQPRVSPIAVKICTSAHGEQEMMPRTNTFTVPRRTRLANMSSLSYYSTKHLSCSPPKLQYIAINMDEENRQCQQMHMSNGAKTRYAADFFRSFMLFTTRKQGEHSKETEMFLKPLGLKRRFPWLKVLDLERVYKPRLPRRLGPMMPNLRYLGLRWTVLDSLPKSVQSLSHLHTLDLKHTNVTTVPRKILKAGSLQHLYMNEVWLDQSIYRKASYQKSLAKLKTLWGLHLGGKSAMLDVLGKLTGLRKLGLTCHDMVASCVAKSVASLTNLQSLRLRSLDIFDHPSGLNLSDMSQLQSLSNLYLIGVLTAKGLQGLPRTLQVLTLSMTRLEEDPMQVLKELTGLTSLTLLASSYRGQSMTCTKGTFPALRVLKLWKLELLKRWTIEASALPSLQELEMRNCTRLKHIVGLEHLPRLEEINLTKVMKAVAATAEARCPHAVVIARELAVSPQSNHPIYEIEEEAEKDDSIENDGDDNDHEKDDVDESNGIEVEASDDNDCDKGDSIDDKGTDEGTEEEQENEYEAEAANGDGGGDEDEDKDENGNADDNREKEEKEGGEEQNEDETEDSDDQDFEGDEIDNGNGEEQEIQYEAEAANGDGGGDEDQDKDKKGNDGDNREKEKKEGGEEQNEDKAEDSDDQDFEGDEIENENDEIKDEEQQREDGDGQDYEEENDDTDDREKNQEESKGADAKDRYVIVKKKIQMIKREMIKNMKSSIIYGKEDSYKEGDDNEDGEKEKAKHEEQETEDEVEEDDNDDYKGDNDIAGNDKGEDEEQNTDEAEDKDENDYEEREDDDHSEGGGGFGNQEEGNDEREKEENEVKANDGDRSDYEDKCTDIEGNNEGEDLEQQNTDEADYEEREEHETEKEEGDDNENEEGGDNEDDGRNDEREDEEQQIVGEAEDEDDNDNDNDNDNDERDDGNSRKEEEEENRNGAEAVDDDDGDHEDGGFNNHDDEGEINNSKMKMKLNLEMEMEADVKNELTLTVVWKKMKDDKKMRS